MRNNDNNITRRMNLILWFLVVAFPFYLLGLQFYFSAKGALLSSAVAAAFGALASMTAKKNSAWQSAVSLLSPFVFVGSVVLFCPVPAAMLFGLCLAVLFVLLNISQHSSVALVAGGRAELSHLLQSAANNHLTAKYKDLLRAWSMGAAGSFLLFALIGSHWLAYIPLVAIAVVLSSVIRSSSGKESK
ncbi:MAG: hypothetical protein EBR09_07215 [Proteobacteria bacterium]|nr:hypothetical protein [Pseudomonadota bacterium]